MSVCTHPITVGIQTTGLCGRHAVWFGEVLPGHHAARCDLHIPPERAATGTRTFNWIHGQPAPTEARNIRRLTRWAIVLMTLAALAAAFTHGIFWG